MSSKTTGHSDIHWHDFDIHKEDYDNDTNPEMSKKCEIEGVDIDSLDHHAASEYILSESILDAIRHTGDRQLSPPHIIDPIGDKNPKDLIIDEALVGKGMYDYGYEPSSHKDREAEDEDLAKENGYSKSILRAVRHTKDPKVNPRNNYKYWHSIGHQDGGIDEDEYKVYETDHHYEERNAKESILDEVRHYNGAEVNHQQAFEYWQHIAGEKDRNESKSLAGYDYDHSDREYEEELEDESYQLMDLFEDGTNSNDCSPNPHTDPDDYEYWHSIGEEVAEERMQHKGKSAVEEEEYLSTAEDATAVYDDDDDDNDDQGPQTDLEKKKFKQFYENIYDLIDE